MRILYVVQYYQPMNAASITTHEILRKLAEKGHETTLLVPRRCPKQCIRDCSLECENNDKIIVHRVLPSVPYSATSRYTTMGTLVLAFCHLFMILYGLRIIKEKKFDVIISQHHPSHFASLSACVLSRVSRLPLVIKTHDVYDSSYSVFQSLFLRLLDNMYRVVFKHASSILVVSHPLRSSLIRTYGLERNKIFVFSNSVNTKEFRPNIDCNSLRSDLEVDGKKVILFVGRLSKDRGLTLLIEALPMVVAENSNVAVLVIGDGPQKSDMIRMAYELNVKRFVRFITSVSYSDMPKYICISDVAIGPLVATIDTYGSVPRKILEYMACGKPVVACRGGVSDDLIVDGYNGFLFHPENIQELASLILRSLSGSDLVKEVGLNARMHIEKFHDSDKIIDEFERAMQETLEND